MEGKKPTSTWASVLHPGCRAGAREGGQLKGCKHDSFDFLLHLFHLAQLDKHQLLPTGYRDSTGPAGSAQ